MLDECSLPIITGQPSSLVPSAK